MQILPQKKWSGSFRIWKMPRRYTNKLPKAELRDAWPKRAMVHRFPAGKTREASAHKKRCFQSIFERPVLASFQSLAQPQLEPLLISGLPRRDAPLYTP